MELSFQHSATLWTFRFPVASLLGDVEMIFADKDMSVPTCRAV